MSPQTRRGKATPAGHRKPASHSAAPTAGKPSPHAADTAEVSRDAEAPSQSGGASRSKQRPRGGIVSRIRRSAGYRYIDELIGAYIPILIVFVVVFIGLWAWISFGPHTLTPQQNWSQIEAKYIPKRAEARVQIVNAKDFQERLAGYKAYDQATRDWMDELAKVSDWSQSTNTDAQNSTQAGYVASFVSSGKDLLQYLDAEAGASDASTLETFVEQGQNDEQVFDANWQTVENQIMGSAASTSLPSMLPEITEVPNPCATAAPGTSPTASGSPGASSSPAVCSSPAPSDSAGPSSSIAPGSATPSN